MFLTFLLVQIDKNPIIGHSQMQLMRHYFESLHAGHLHTRIECVIILAIRS